MDMNERNMKGKWKEMNAQWKENAWTWRKMHENKCNTKGTWSVAEAPENQQNNCSIHFRACLGMDFGFMLDLEYADFHKALESNRAPPKAIATTIATTQM